MSDIVSADGKQIDRRFLAPLQEDSASISSCNFLEEQPTADDWAAWAEFWGRYTDVGLVLPRTLGAWVAPTYWRWLWFYDEEAQPVSFVDVMEIVGCIQVQNGQNLALFIRATAELSEMSETLE